MSSYLLASVVYRSCVIPLSGASFTNKLHQPTVKKKLAAKAKKKWKKNATENKDRSKLFYFHLGEGHANHLVCFSLHFNIFSIFRFSFSLIAHTPFTFFCLYL